MLGHADRVTNRVDFLAPRAALLGVLLFDTLPGLVIGIGVSLGLLIARTSRPISRCSHRSASGSRAGPPGGERMGRPARHPDLPGEPGARSYGSRPRCSSANADYVRDHVRDLVAETPGLRLVVLDGQTTPSIDVTASAMLMQLRTDLRRHGVELGARAQRRSGARRAQAGPSRRRAADLPSDRGRPLAAPPDPFTVNG